MGNSISEIAEDSLRGKTGAELDGARRCLEQLSKDADRKSKELMANLRSNEDIYVGIEKLLLFQSKIFCRVNSDTKSLEEGVRRFVGNIFGGDFINAVANMISMSVAYLIGNTYGTEREDRTYFVCPTRCSILRVDMLFWARDLSFDGLISATRNVLVCAYSVSTIEPSEDNIRTVAGVMSMSKHGSHNTSAAMEYYDALYSDKQDTKDIICKLRGVNSVEKSEGHMVSDGRESEIDGQSISDMPGKQEVEPLDSSHNLNEE
jgi:hypothetical protein